jgi:hypothetical protein
MEVNRDIEELSVEEIYANKRIDQITLIVLYGLGNSGKTSTLINVVKLLISPKAYASHIWNNGKRYQDVMIIIKFKEKLIYISTKGDGRNECEENILFFRRKLDETKILVVHKNKVVSLSSLSASEIKELYRNAKPDICISASRTDGGSVAASDYHMMERLPSFRTGIWIRKVSAKQKLDEELLTSIDRQVAEDMKNLIKRLIGGKTI